VANYYLNPSTGSDSAAGTVGAPFLTWAHAKAVAISGDTVFVAIGCDDATFKTFVQQTAFATGVTATQSYTAPAPRVLRVVSGGGLKQTDALDGSTLIRSLEIALSNTNAGTATKLLGYDSSDNLVRQAISGLITDLDLGDLAFEDVADPTEGGTGLTSCIAGDLFKGSGANTVDKLAGPTGAAAKFLRAIGTGGGSPAFSSMAWGNVTGADLDDGGVTLAKLANVSTAIVLGRATAGTGVPEAMARSTFFALNSSNGHFECTINSLTFGIYCPDASTLDFYIGSNRIGGFTL
jgi:hypothetical protein